MSIKIIHKLFIYFSIDNELDLLDKLFMQIFMNKIYES